MDPEQIDATLDRANRLLEAGKPHESLRCLDRLEDVLVDSDDRIECASLKAYALTEIDDHDEALRALQPLLEEFPESARLYGALGIVLSGSNRLEQARDALETAVALDGLDESLLANLALIYERLRDFRTALQLYDRSLELGADLDWALQRKAAALTELGEYEEAKGTLSRYLSLVPEDAEQWVTLGILHSDQEAFELAYACYAQAAQHAPDLPTLRLNWGISAVRAGDVALARQQHEHLKRLDGQLARAALLEAFIREEERDIRGAHRCYRRILSSLKADAGAELDYALEMAMDFYARHKQRGMCEELLERAYASNGCSVELCEPYRSVTGQPLRKAYWFSILLEADYRPGLAAVLGADIEPGSQHARYQRAFQVVAADRDDAIQFVIEFARRFGETNVAAREFLREEALENVHAGIYEIEKESLVVA